MTSYLLRKEATELYQKTFPKEIDVINGKSFQPAPSIQVSRCKEIQRKLLEAQNKACEESNGVEWIAATKGYGITSFRLANLPHFQHKKTFSMSYIFIMKLCSFYQFHKKRLKMLIRQHPTALNEAIDGASKFIINSKSSWRKRCGVLEGLLLKISSNDIATALIFTEIANELMKSAVIADVIETGEKLCNVRTNVTVRLTLQELPCPKKNLCY